MPTISANASQQITIPAGQRLRFLVGGAGIGLLAGSNGFDGQFALGPSEQMIGPFPSDRVFRVSCTQAVQYQLQAPPFDAFLSSGNAIVSVDASGNQVANGYPVSGGGVLSGNGLTTSRQAWRLASFGDSRADFGSAGFSTSGLTATAGAVFDPTKCPTWAAALLGDAEYVANFGVGGDTITTGAANTGWYNPTRTASKTMSALGALTLDAVHVQYGFNDANNATITNTTQRDAVAASMTLAAQRLISTLIGMNLLVVFETSYPARDVTGWASNGALRQGCLDTFNANIVAWLNTNFVPRKLAAVADSATLLKQADGFANSSYYISASNVHLNEAGARLAGATVAAAIRTLLPKKPLPVRSPSSLTKPANLIARNAQSPVTYVYTGSGDAGSGTITGAGWGYDASTGESYYEMTWTPTGLNGSNYARCKLTIQSSVGHAAALFSVAGTGETFEGAARVTIDDGAGGAPNAYSISLRSYYVAATVSTNLEWGGIGSATTVPNFTAPVDLRLWTPRVLNTGAGALTAPTGGSADEGIALQLFVQAKATGIPIRIRLYPSMQQVA